MVGLLATLGAEGKPLPTMVSLVVTSHETSAFFSVSWGCFATILLGIVVVRMSEEVRVNPQLIQERAPGHPGVPSGLTAAPAHDRYLSWSSGPIPVMQNLDSP